MGNTQPKTPIYVNHENTCKTDTKIIEIHFFSDRKDIENSFEVWWVDPISLFSDPKVNFNTPYNNNNDRHYL